MNCKISRFAPIAFAFAAGCVCTTMLTIAPSTSSAFAFELRDPKAGNVAAGTNRVVAGDPVPVGKVWAQFDKDVYMHFQKAANFDNAADCARAGFRAVCGPNKDSGEKVNVTLVQSPRTVGGEETDLAPEADGGYAAVWGWRPYVRLRRISAAAEGSWIIVQALPGDPDTDRVILAYTEAAKKVSIWRNDQPSDAQPIATLAGDMMFVDVKYSNGAYSVTEARPVSADSKAAELVEWVREKMK